MAPPMFFGPKNGDSCSRHMLARRATRGLSAADLSAPLSTIAALVAPHLAMNFSFRGRDQRPLLRRRLVLALLLVVPATAAVSASAGIVQAVEECRLEPGWPAPSGSKWLSRINREHRRCWFLSSGVTGDHHTQVRQAASARNRHRAADAAWPDQQRDSDLQKASAPQDKAEDAVAAEPPAAPQVTPSVQQSSESLLPHSVPTIAYRVLPPSAQTVSGPTAVAARTAEPMPAGASKSNVVVLSGAATAAGLLFAGGVFHFTRRGQLRSRKRTVADRHGVRWQVVSWVAANPSPMTTDWADDLTRKTARA